MYTAVIDDTFACTSLTKSGRRRWVALGFALIDLLLLSACGGQMPAAAQIVRLGAGSYTTALPAGAKEPQVQPYVAPGDHRPVPTNRWWSSLVFSQFSNQMFPHPLGVQASEKGLRIYYPGAGYTANREGIFTAVMREPDDLVIGHSECSQFPDARAEAWSDWFVSTVFASAQNRLHLTFGHGSPFVYGTIQGGSPTVSFRNPPTIFAGNTRSSTIGVSISGRNYGLFGPSGCHWEGLGTSRLTCVLDGKSYFSVALLPDSSSDTLAFFARYAHNHVTNTRVTWSFDERSSKVSTHYTFTTKSWEGSATGTVVGLYPHQYQRSSLALTKYSYQTIRGVLKVGVGDGFTTVTPYQGVLPYLPSIGSDRSTLKRYVDSDAISFKPAPADTYWTGKALGKLATLSSIADVSNNAAARDQFKSRLKAILETYFTAESKSSSLFYYNRSWGTLIGYPASYGSDESINDHHFHYGYFIRAAAELARLEPEWAIADRWGGMVNLLIRDCASPDRDDPMFPLLRNFDIYEGHSWADGKGDFADGNDNESSSEAMNAWTGIILWGEATGNVKLRDLGIYLYVTEKDAIDNYWFDAHRLYPAAFTMPMVSMLWGAKAVYATWFSGDPISMHGINILPVQSGSLYLGTDPALVRRNVEGLTTERKARDAKDPKRGPVARVGANWGDWGDIIQMYHALSDAPGAIAETNFETQSIEGGNSRANLYLWLSVFNAVGAVDASISADTTSYAVFKKGGRRTYIAYNPGKAAKTVTFSDGKTIRVDGHDMAVENGEAR